VPIRPTAHLPLIYVNGAPDRNGRDGAASADAPEP
jgi:hypothetical protein